MSGANTPPTDAQPLHGGNVYFPVEADGFDGMAERHELLVAGGLFAITLVAGLVAVCMLAGFGWAHLHYLLAPFAI